MARRRGARRRGGEAALKKRLANHTVCPKIFPIAHFLLQWIGELASFWRGGELATFWRGGELANLQIEILYRVSQEMCPKDGKF